MVISSAAAAAPAICTARAAAIACRNGAISSLVLPGSGAEAGTPFSSTTPSAANAATVLTGRIDGARAFRGHATRQPASARTIGPSGTVAPCRDSSQAITAESVAGDGSPSAPSASIAAAPSASEAPAPPCASGSSKLGRPRSATACQ